MIARRNRIVLVILIATLMTVPYLVAAFQPNPDWIFGGFLKNPLDGNSYLAKMQEGWAGGWRFTLLYSPEQVEGAYLFLFYLFLGHIARWTGVSLEFVFHAARIAGCIFLVMAMAKFCDLIFPASTEDKRLADRALWLASLGGGLGWLVVGWGGYLTGDFWIAETYPFLSMVENPHFTIGLGMLLWVVCMDLDRTASRHGPFLLLLGGGLAIIQPFGLVILAMLLAAGILTRYLDERRLDFRSIVWALAFGGPILLYQFYAINLDPVLSGWNRQNITSAPPFWDFAISLMPALLFALPGGVLAWRNRKPRLLLVTLWLVLGSGLVFMPFSLQRRFMSGLFVPAAVLGVYGASWVSARLARRGKWIWAVFIASSIITNGLILVSVTAVGLSVSSSQTAQRLYLTRPEWRALTWLKANTPQGSVVLANPEMGLFIPAWSGRRVVYGHPFESLKAFEQMKAVEQFFGPTLTRAQRLAWLEDQNVAFIVIDESRERLSDSQEFRIGKEVFGEDTVHIYQVNP